MAERTIACAKCGTTMEGGFVVDHSYGEHRQSTWVGGAPEVSVWSGLKMRGKQLLAVETYRCPRCDYLESYAAAADSR